MAEETGKVRSGIPGIIQPGNAVPLAVEGPGVCIRFIAYRNPSGISANDVCCQDGIDRGIPIVDRTGELFQLIVTCNLNILRPPGD